MKKILSFSIAAVLTVLFLVSCQENCKNCRTKTTSGSDVSYGNYSEYCDSALETVENEPPTTVGDMTSTWVCE